MTLVTPQRLNDYMNSPEWTQEQQNAVRDILAGLEGELEGHLSGAYLTPRQVFETAPILRSGMLHTRQPVFSVSQIDGVTVDEAHPLQLPWVLTEHRLRNTATGQPSYGVLTLPSSLTGAWGATRGGRVDSHGQATVLYMGGWGAVRAGISGTPRPGCGRCRAA